MGEEEEEQGEGRRRFKVTDHTHEIPTAICDQSACMHSYLAVLNELVC